MPVYENGQVYLDRQQGDNLSYYFMPVTGGFRSFRDMRREGAPYRRAFGSVLITQSLTIMGSGVLLGGVLMYKNFGVL